MPESMNETERDSSKMDGPAEETPAAGPSLPSLLDPAGPVRRTTEGILDAVWRAVREHPLGWLGAAEVLSGKLRAARHLHSHERRVVADALHQIVRGQRRLQVLAGQPHPQPHVLYLAWV